MEVMLVVVTDPVLSCELEPLPLPLLLPLPPLSLDETLVVAACPTIVVAATQATVYEV